MNARLLSVCSGEGTTAVWVFRRIGKQPLSVCHNIDHHGSIFQQICGQVFCHWCSNYDVGKQVFAYTCYICLVKFETWMEWYLMLLQCSIDIMFVLFWFMHLGIRSIQLLLAKESLMIPCFAPSLVINRGKLDWPLILEAEYRLSLLVGLGRVGYNCISVEI